MSKTVQIGITEKVHIHSKIIQYLQYEGPKQWNPKLWLFMEKKYWDSCSKSVEPMWDYIYLQKMTLTIMKNGIMREDKNNSNY